MMIISDQVCKICGAFSAGNGYCSGYPGHPWDPRTLTSDELAAISDQGGAMCPLCPSCGRVQGFPSATECCYCGQQIADPDQVDSIYRGCGTEIPNPNKEWHPWSMDTVLEVFDKLRQQSDKNQGK